MTEQSPRLARTLVAVAMRDHALACFVCRSGATLLAGPPAPTLEEQAERKERAYRWIGHCSEAQRFLAAWRMITNYMETVGAVPTREVSDR